MASKKKQMEGIALLSMYNDDEEEDYEDDEEMEDAPQQEQQQSEPEESQTDDGAVQGNSSSGAIQVLSPGIRTTPQLSEHVEASQSDQIDIAATEIGAVEIQDAVMVDRESTDPLDKFLPSPPKEKCPEELQRKIDKFLALKKIGRSFNAEVRNRKDYRNPDFLLHAVRYQDIDQTGSCFRKDVFDPHGYDKSDYYDEIEIDMRRDRERKEQELKRSPRVEFVAGGTQPGVVIPPSKFSMPIPGAKVAVGSVLPSAPSVVDAVAREGRQTKKSKWDTVDVDGRNPLPSGGQDTLAAAQAAILSAANVGAGYNAFVQQKRREAEEKRSSERKFEKRS